MSLLPWSQCLSLLGESGGKARGRRKYLSLSLSLPLCLFFLGVNACRYWGSLEGRQGEEENISLSLSLSLYVSSSLESMPVVIGGVWREGKGKKKLSLSLSLSPSMSLLPWSQCLSLLGESGGKARGRRNS